MKKSKVSIIILNWNGKKNTLECLKSINTLRTELSKIKIIVVDNASRDDSVKAIKKASLKYPLIVLRNKKNLGFAEGNNVGISYALKKGADFIMILNNDTKVDKNLVDNLLKAAERHPEAGILSPKIYFAKGFEFHKKRYKEKDFGKVIWYAGGEFDWKNVYGKNRGVDKIDKGQFNKEESIDFATGACLFVRAQALKETGMFNKNYYLYLEDADLSLRMKKRGWEIVFVPTAFIWHKVSQSSKIGGDLNDYFLTRNRIYFALTHAPLRSKIAVIRESFKLLLLGRKWQRLGVRDFYLGKLGKGTWKN